MEYVRELDTRAAGTAATQSALKVHRLTFMEAAMLVVGSTIGSGVLGLAYASRLAGWPVLFVWLVVAGIFSGISMLYVAETALRTQEPLQLSGLAEKYVGRIGSWLIFFSVGATSFCSLIAYTAGCGRILSECTGLTPELAGILFAAAATVVVWGGLKVTGVAEKFLSLGMIIMLLLLAGASVVSARVPLADILYTHWAYAVPVFNIAVFCYAVQYIVPELARGFTHAPQKLVPSLLTGMGISFLILASVPLSVFLMLPVAEITEVASLSWGRALQPDIFFFLVNAFAFCAMLTSFWAISESFLTNMVDRLHLASEGAVKGRALCLAVIVIPPVFLASGNLVGFVNALFSAGTFGGIIMSVLPVFMLRQARRRGNRQPCWQCGRIASLPVQLLVVALFSGAGIYALCSLVGLLPPAW